MNVFLRSKAGAAAIILTTGLGGLAYATQPAFAGPDTATAQDDQDCNDNPDQTAGQEQGHCGSAAGAGIGRQAVDQGKKALDQAGNTGSQPDNPNGVDLTDYNCVVYRGVPQMRRPDMFDVGGLQTVSCPIAYNLPGHY